MSEIEKIAKYPEGFFGARLVILRQLLEKLLKQKKPHVLLDFFQIEHVTSSGMVALAGIVRPMEAMNHSIGFSELGNRVRQVFDIGGFSNLLLTDETRAEAAKILGFESVTNANWWSNDA